MPSSLARRREKILADFQRNLAADSIPTTIIADETSKRAIQFAISSMTLIIVEIKRNPTFIQKSIAIFLNAWPGVWKWLQFLFTQCVAKNHHGQALMLQSLRIIPFIITIFGRDNGAGLRTLIIRTPGIFYILIPRWLQERTD